MGNNIIKISLTRSYCGEELEELIYFDIGSQVCLSRTPKVKEWQVLYAVAKKQSLVGVHFAGVQKLKAQKQASN